MILITRLTYVSNVYSHVQGMCFILFRIVIGHIPQ